MKKTNQNTADSDSKSNNWPCL